MRFLLFTLYAPMASFGEIAVGEQRMSWTRPGRSAIIGLVAAALGIKRTEEDAQHSLAQGLYYAVRTDVVGRPFLDYHTAQTPKAKKGRVFATRREELASGDLHTVLSSREWRADAFCVAALWPRNNNAGKLDEIAEALQRPRFTLYLGRKAAPLGLPARPKIIEATAFLDAFKEYRRTPEENKIIESISPKAKSAWRQRAAKSGSSPDDATSRVEYAFDHDAPGAPAGFRVQPRRDVIVSRKRWQFDSRLEGVAFVPRQDNP